MPKKIVILNGSPRRAGNTSALVKAFAEGAEGHDFEDVLLYYDHLMKHLRRENLGHVLAGGNGDARDIQGKPELQKAYDLGKLI